MFKNETHNHPTEIEPYGGASTCIGGGIRDPLSGRSFVYGAMRITGSADPREAFADTYTGKLAQRKITQTAAEGYSDYANQIGLASGHLKEYYHPGFKAKRMECGALVSYAMKKDVRREDSLPGDVIIMLGGKTGRDGVGGATGSSAEQVGATTNYSAEVQKGNPILERNIMRLFRKPNVTAMIKKCNDFGAGGVSVAVGELAESLHIYLDRVELKYGGLDATEIAISESQERMAVVIERGDIDAFMAELAVEHLDGVVIADVTDSGRIEMEYAGQVVCNVSSTFLNSGGKKQHADVRVELPTELAALTEDITDVSAHLATAFSQLHISSQEAIASQFDKTIGGATALYPFGGTTRKTPELGLAMRVPLPDGVTDLGTLMTVGYNPMLAEVSPFHGAYYAVLESVMKIIAMGGKLADIRLTFQEYFESMKSSESWGKVYAAMLGAFAVEHALGLPSVGGKDSMSGSYQELNVPPTLISFAVAPVDITTTISKGIKQVGSTIYLLATEKLADGMLDLESLQANIQLFGELHTAGNILSASPVGTAGIAQTVAEMAFGEMHGCAFVEGFTDTVTFTAGGDMLIESTAKLDLPIIGQTIAQPELVINGEEIALATLLATSEETLAEVFDTTYSTPKGEPVTLAAEHAKPAPRKVAAQPVVCMPIFYGSSGEYTLEKAFTAAGFVVETVLVHPTKTTDFTALATTIAAADILALPTGMTLGARPMQAASFINIVLQKVEVAAAVNTMIAAGGLVLGFGESMKALIDSGLIQHGKVQTKTDAVVMTKNKINQYYSGFATVSHAAKDSFWEPQATQVAPVAGNFGAIAMDAPTYQTYVANGQILGQYTDRTGAVAADYTSNPFGADYGVATLTSPNGQVYGSMIDPSQMQEGLYLNIPQYKATTFFTDLLDFFQAL